MTDVLEPSLRWVGELVAAGPCDLVVLHLFAERQELDRLGLAAKRGDLEANMVLRSTLERELRERCAKTDGKLSMRVRVEPRDGALANRILSVAREECADLIVLGSSLRDHGGTLWRRTVSHEVLESARICVACVPHPVMRALATIPQARRVLVATDFSEVGNDALSLAQSVLASDGTLELVHVLPEQHMLAAAHDLFDTDLDGLGADAEVAVGRLNMLRPVRDEHDPAKTKVHVVRASNVAAAICQVAERLDVDLICMGTHGRSGVSKLVRGSTAQAVLERSLRPVLFSRVGKRSPLAAARVPDLCASLAPS